MYHGFVFFEFKEYFILDANTPDGSTNNQWGMAKTPTD